jgi:hypothetical protein
MAKNYLAVDTSSPNYPLVEGTFFNKFDCYTEFVKAVERVAPGMLNYKILSERVGQKPRREVLIECSFKASNFSSAPFFIYVCPIEGGGRFEDEQRIQFNPSNRWSPNLHSLEKAHKFLVSDDKTGLETYVLGIYKTSENDDNIVFSGLYPNSIETTETDNNKNSTSSVQVRIGSIQKAYQSGVDMENTSTGFPIINFTPNNLFWYMINRDQLHVGDLEQIANLVKARKTMPLSIPKIDELGSLQKIYFGAPGTGKSHKINEMCAKYENYRTTFHPDTDYSSFVGSYKPITKRVPVYGIQGTQLKDDEGNKIMEDRIVYRYVFQSFLKAYIAAWREQQHEEPKPVFLIVEEINRGNCAQIFGDIFQLLDRNADGFSEYPIIADDDLAQELKRAFAELNIVNAEKINALYDEGKDVVSQVKSGSHLLLPNNLYIWATMNTSDQSLFPIDSAFKRRWDWKYIKIKDAEKDYRISLSNGNQYDWWQFVSAINAQIEGGEIQQEDKKLGYFFAKTSDGKISAETFVSKVLFYLYNDVFKDFGLDEGFFKDEDGETMTFASYFDHLGNVQEDRVELFIRNLGIKPLTENTEENEEDKGNPFIGLYVNDQKYRSITDAVIAILTEAAKQHTYAEIANTVSRIPRKADPIVKSIDNPGDYQGENRWNKTVITDKDGQAFVVSNQWGKWQIPAIKEVAAEFSVETRDAE